MRSRPAALGAVVLAAAAAGADGAPGTAAKPLPFSLVSAAGTQAATNLHAGLCPRPARPCPFSWGDELPPAGPAPTRLSVVRPGERIRFVLPAGARTVTVAGVRTPPTAEFVQVCSSRARTILVPLSAPTWAVRLPPARYAVVVFFFRRAAHGVVGEVGVFGLLVSRTRRPAIVAADPCPHGARGGGPYTYP